MSPRSTDLPDQSGKRIIVTGANTGLGFQSALAFARAGADVLFGVRNLEKGRAAATRIAAEVPGASLRVEKLDLAELASVFAFAEEESDRGPIDVLMNNAGVMLVPERGLTADGFESHMGINHLGHFALTAALLPAIADTGRVVTISSLAHRAAPRLDQGLNLSGRYSPMGAYAQSKLANLVFGLELDRRLRASGSTVASVLAHPGWSATELLDRADKPGVFVAVSRKTTQWMGSSPVNGARPQILAAVGAGVKSGDFLGPSALAWGVPVRVSASAVARDRTVGSWLWEVSESLTGATFQMSSSGRHSLPD